MNIDYEHLEQHTFSINNHERYNTNINSTISRHKNITKCFVLMNLHIVLACCN